MSADALPHATDLSFPYPSLRPRPSLIHPPPPSHPNSRLSTTVVVWMMFCGRRRCYPGVLPNNNDWDTLPSLYCHAFPPTKPPSEPPNLSRQYTRTYRSRPHHLSVTPGAPSTGSSVSTIPCYPPAFPGGDGPGSRVEEAPCAARQRGTIGGREMDRPLLSSECGASCKNDVKKEPGSFTTRYASCCASTTS